MPRYEPNDETETYVLEGEQLTPLAHRGPVRKRADDVETFEGRPVKVFHTRVEGEFRKILRHWASRDGVVCSVAMSG